MIKEFKPPYPRFEELQKQLIDIAWAQDIANINCHPDGQLAVQTSGVGSLHDGVGTAKSTREDWEHSFNQIHSLFKDTLIEDYINWLGVPVYRTRIMLTREKSSYSIHKDRSPRLHLPLVTNKQCFFLFAEPDETRLHHFPADGRTTWVDTRKMHTFINGSTEHRLHLVMIVEE
jgi:hypothetical protein